MSKTKKTYKRLKGTGRSLLRSNKLYMAKDHLLSIESYFVSEEYKRFYYKDIEAITYRKTGRGMILNLCFAFLGVLLYFPAFLMDGGWSTFFYISGSLFLPLLLINWLRGPTCVSHLITPVQTARLFSLNRIKKASKAVSSLKPLIESFQGILTTEDLKNVEQKESQAVKLKKIRKYLREEKGTIHRFLFLVLILEGILTAIELYINQPAFTIFASITSLGLLLLIILALVKQTGSNLDNSIKIMTWVSMGFVIIYYISAYIFYIYFAISNPDMVQNQWLLVKHFSDLQFQDYPWMMRWLISIICIFPILGILGLVFVKQFTRQQRLYSPNSEFPRASVSEGSI